MIQHILGPFFSGGWVRFHPVMFSLLSMDLTIYTKFEENTGQSSACFRLPTCCSVYSVHTKNFVHAEVWTLKCFLVVSTKGHEKRDRCCCKKTATVIATIIITIIIIININNKHNINNNNYNIFIIIINTIIITFCLRAYTTLTLTLISLSSCITAKHIVISMHWCLTADMH